MAENDSRAEGSPRRSLRRRAVFVAVLGALAAVGPFTIDLYLPAFPVVIEELRTNESRVQATLAATIIGFAVGQLIVGPWSDVAGRRAPLLTSTSIHVASSLGVAMAPTVEWVTVFRLGQGIGAAGGSVIAAAMIRDVYSGYPLARTLARLALVTSVAPLIAPYIGAQLMQIAGWRGIFWALAGYGVAVIVACALLLPETRPRVRGSGSPSGGRFRRYRALLTDRAFVGVAIIGGMQYSALFAYLSSSSVLFQDAWGLAPQQYGLLIAMNAIGMVVGTQASARLMRRIEPQWILAVSLTAVFLASASVGVVDALGGGLVGISCALFLFAAACGFGFPCVQVLGLARHGEEAGTAASLLGIANFGLAGLILPVTGSIPLPGALPMSSVMASVMVVAIIVFWTVVRPRRLPGLESSSAAASR